MKLLVVVIILYFIGVVLILGTVCSSVIGINFCQVTVDSLAWEIF